MNSIASAHDRSFRARFPQLINVKMEYHWGGLLCLSRNSAPAFGEMEPNLYSACCQNGLGVARGTLTGKLIAEHACGKTSGPIEFMLKQPQPKKLPPEPFASIGGKCVMHWGEFKAGKER